MHSNSTVMTVMINSSAFAFIQQIGAQIAGQGRTWHISRKGFRNKLFSMAYKKCGESLGSLARLLGKRGKDAMDTLRTCGSARSQSQGLSFTGLQD
jgi:hypothetical protein